MEGDDFFFFMVDFGAPRLDSFSLLTMGISSPTPSPSLEVDEDVNSNIFLITPGKSVFMISSFTTEFVPQTRTDELWFVENAFSTNVVTGVSNFVGGSSYKRGEGFV